MAAARHDRSIWIGRGPTTSLPRSYREWDAVLWALAGLPLAVLFYPLVTDSPGANSIQS